MVILITIMSCLVLMVDNVEVKAEVEMLVKNDYGTVQF